MMQIDFDGHEFARTGNWQDPREKRNRRLGGIEAKRNVGSEIGMPRIVRSVEVAFVWTTPGDVGGA